MKKDRDHSDDDQNLQNQDHVKKQNQAHSSGEKGSGQDKEDKITGNPERLRNSDHRMNKRTNEVQGEVDYGQNKHQPNEEPDQDLESRWTDIEKDYRKRHTNLTDDDVHNVSGDFNHVLGRIAKRTNRTSEDVYKEIREWDKDHK